MSYDRDQWFTAPLECSHCGGEHSRRYCASLKEEEGEAAEVKADDIREERAIAAAEYRRKEGRHER